MDIDKALGMYDKGFKHGFSEGLNWAAQNAGGLAATDSQQLQAAVALVRAAFAQEPHGVTMYKDFNSQLDYIEQRAAV